jgi:acetylornithine deacetylase
MAVEMDLTGAIGAAVDRNRDATTHLLLDLVAAPSLTGREAPTALLMKRECERRGLATKSWSATAKEMAGYEMHVGEQARYRNRPNVAAVRKGAGGGRSLILNGHMDTVPVGDPALWSRDPSGEIAGGRIYGRGSCDMKGGLTTILAALDALDACGITLRGDVTVLATVGEEDGGLGALSSVLRGYRADAVVITEPTNLRLIPAHVGSLVFRLTITGRNAHAAMRDAGVSAFETFVPIFHDLQAFERERNETQHHPLFDQYPNKMPINVGVVHTGEWASTVPDRLVAEIRTGFLPGETMEQAQQAVIDRIMAQANQDPWLREHPPAIEWFGGQFESADTPVAEPICQAIIAAHETITGQRPDIAGMTGGADMRLFQRFGGMPSVMSGAGDAIEAHAPDESIAVDDLLTATKTAAQLLCDWCGIARQEDA